jgi:hypothetical protein
MSDDHHLHDDDHTPSRRGPIIGLIAVVVLAVVGIWISHILHATGQIQDCVMAGRTNCVIIH